MAIDWNQAVKVAARMTGSYPLEGTYHEARFALQAPQMVMRATALVEEETGLHAPGVAEVAVVSRKEWVENNIGSFAVLVKPAEERLAAHTGIGAKIASRITAAELGAVLGLLSRRVLGQYELVLPKADGSDGDTVMFVGANILAMERQHEFRPNEFRFWVALHEATHRLQFLGVPWMKDYFLSLVSDLVTASAPQKGTLSRVANDLAAAARAGEPLVDEAGLFGIFATPSQRQAIDRVQALMSLLEGHGHVVMDRIGARELVTQDRMSQVLKARRQDPRTAMFMRLVGLEMKMRQYDDGAEFIAGVERHAGWSALDQAWQSPDHLPTLEEIKNPVLWLERMG
ncbi:MAG: hypothetical protein HKN91_13865 [Acidimicrobiia bacterium]|nr:hypothetical protein [Acidimicrobiia bacterium]